MHYTLELNGLKFNVPIQKMKEYMGTLGADWHIMRLFIEEVYMEGHRKNYTSNQINMALRLLNLKLINEILNTISAETWGL